MIIDPKKRDVALVVDDSPETLRLLTDALDGAGMTVMVALDGASAMRIVDQITPDIVLMDLSRPVLDGVEATRRIATELPDVRVLVLTMHDDPGRTRAAIAAGASGYLTKGTSFAEVLQTIRLVASGETFLSPALAVSMLRAAEDAAATEDLLSERQVEILQKVANGYGTKQVARDLGITQKTVHNHLNAIYRKLDTQSLTHAVLSAVRLGIIHLDQN